MLSNFARVQSEYSVDLGSLPNGTVQALRHGVLISSELCDRN